MEGSSNGEPLETAITDTGRDAPEESESLSPQALSAMQTRFERNFAKRRKWATVVQIITGVYVISLLMTLIAISVKPELEFRRQLIDIWVWCSLPVLITVLVVDNLVKTDSAEFLNSVADKRVIGLLVDIFTLRNAHFRLDTRTTRLAADALIRLLRDLNSGDGELLTTAQRLGLANIALKEEDGQMVNAAIEALAIIGMEESIRPLEAVVVSGAKYSGQDAIHAARLALVHINKRAEQRKTHSVLLRAAEGTPDQESTLIRSSIAPVALDGSTLLRTPVEQEISNVGS